MKTYIPDPEKWASYFQRKSSSGQIQAIGWQRKVIPIEDKDPRVTKSEVVLIEAVTPVQREKERVESELRRIGALKKPSRERKRKHEDITDQRGGSSHQKLKRVSSCDTSGF